MFLLLKDHLEKLVKEPSQIIIDNEFDGYQILIKRELLRYIRKHYDKFPAHKITIKSIGKKSQAHRKALEAYRKKRNKTDRTVSIKEFEKIML